ncbi:MAG: FtsX-like permease family protein [Candidatus Geothermarchaeales archaeon]
MWKRWNIRQPRSPSGGSLFVLHRKLMRDIRRTKGQFLAVLTMVVLGVAMLTAVYGAYANLSAVIDDVYEELNFADFTVVFQWGPQSLGLEVAALEGVAEVEARVVIEAPATFEEGQEPVLGRLVSIPAEGRAAVNDVRVEEGRSPISGLSEVLVEQRFAEHHAVAMGATVYLRNSTGSWPYVVTGRGVSPEYLWPARNLREHMPDILRRWGVLFVPLPDLQAFAGLEGAVNQVAIVLEPEADLDDALQSVLALLDPYGIVDVVTQKSQPSDMILRLTVDSLSQLAFVIPLFFLIIVALSTYVLLTRLVYVQRSQIGMLRALGYSRRSMLAHYLAYALVLGLSGSILGFALGYALSYLVTDLFSRAANLSGAAIQLRPDLLALGMGLSLVFTSIAGIVPAWRASRLGPADAMRPPVPVFGRKPLLERLFPAFSRLSALKKIPTRNIVRNLRRTLFTILGLALGVSVLLVPLSLLDAMDWATEAQGSLIQRYDLKVYLQFPQPVANLTVLEDLEEIARAEPAIEVPTSVLLDGETISVVVMGLEPSAQLYRLYDRSWQPTATAGNGILLAGIYERRGFQVGDSIEVLSHPVEVTGFVSEFGTTGFVTLDTAQAWLGLEGMSTAVMLELAPGVDEEAAKDRLSSLLPVLSIESTRQALQDWQEMMQLFYGFIYMLLAFGIAISLAIVFNAITINVMEASRDLATMRTFGTPHPVLSRLITAETLLLAFPGAILGLILGTYLAGYFTALYSSDLFILDLVIYPQTYLLSLGVAVLVALLSELPSLRFVRRMNLAKVTKERVS